MVTLPVFKDSPRLLQKKYQVSLSFNCTKYNDTSPDSNTPFRIPKNKSLIYPDVLLAIYITQQLEKARSFKTHF